jgi:hypothetical protein
LQFLSPMHNFVIVAFIAFSFNEMNKVIDIKQKNSLELY